ncbi:MAG: extracellular solute-binding protein [Clostridia bacterium]|nr:extracellular solute-binding protein [Clostridia bacterium]
MKRYIRLAAVLMALCLLLTLMLTGCHGSQAQASFELPEEFDTSKQYEITFWAKNDTNVRQTEIYQRAISEFCALYPNITVTLRLYNDYGKIYNDVITNISTQTTPNICITYPDHIATYLTGANTVVPLDELMNDESYGLGGSKLLFDSPTAEQIVPKFLGECKLGDSYYALPFMRSTEACYINKDYVEALGFTLPEVLTWDFIWEVSEAAMAKDENGNYLVNGQKVMIPFIYKSTDNMMIQMLRQLEAGYSDSTGEIAIFNDTTEDLLYMVSEQVGKGTLSTFKISGYPGNFFNAGQCIFAVDSTAGATWIGSDAPLSDIDEDKLVPFETEVMTIPQFNTESPDMISQGPSVCIFNKEDPQEVLASWMFMQYLLTNGIQIDYSKTEGYVPVTTMAQETEEYRDYLSREGEDGDEHYYVKIKAAKLLLANMENTFVTPVFNGSTSLRNAAGQMIENVAKSTRRKETVDAAYIEKLYADVSSLYHLDGIGGAVGKTDRGPLPVTSVVLLASLGTSWVLIIAYVVFEKIKNRKKC